MFSCMKKTFNSLYMFYIILPTYHCYESRSYRKYKLQQDLQNNCYSETQNHICDMRSKLPYIKILTVVVRFRVRCICKSKLNVEEMLMKEVADRRSIQACVRRS